MQMGMVAGIAVTVHVGMVWGATARAPRFGIEFGMGFMRVRMHLTFGTAE